MSKDSDTVLPGRGWLGYRIRVCLEAIPPKAVLRSPTFFVRISTQFLSQVFKNIFFQKNLPIYLPTIYKSQDPDPYPDYVKKSNPDLQHSFYVPQHWPAIVCRSYTYFRRACLTATSMRTRSDSEL
jgi:hypothetical protein